MKISSLRRAAKAKKTLEMFEYNCSHTLCSPLKSIQGLLNLLETETDQEQIGICLDMILKSTLKLDVIIKELNQAVLATEGEEVISCINFPEVIQNVLLNFAQRIELKAIRTSFTVDQREDFYSDATRLTTILTHLICNSIVFSDDRKQTKIIEIRVVVSNGNCSIMVIDNGCGIRGDIQEKIFQPFYRGSEKATGPGLGLFIVAETIRSLHATLQVDSHVGRGSAFTLELPSTRN
jgi:signal transduction histidine kinase